MQVDAQRAQSDDVAAAEAELRATQSEQSASEAEAPALAVADTVSAGLDANTGLAMSASETLSKASTRASFI